VDNSHEEFPPQQHCHVLLDEVSVSAKCLFQYSGLISDVCPMSAEIGLPQHVPKMTGSAAFVQPAKGFNPSPMSFWQKARTLVFTEK